MSAPAFRRPLGLVLPGAGALGCWQTAALRVLDEAGVAFDSIVSFSAGALTGAHYAIGRLADALERWRALEGGVLRPRPRLFPPSLFSDAPVWEAVRDLRDDEALKSRLKCRLTVVTARPRRDRFVYADFAPGAAGPWDAPLAAHVVASCAIPVIFPPQRLAYRGRELTLVDGGVPCAEPMAFAALAGCRDVLVLEVVRADEIGRRPSLFGFFDQHGRETLKRLVDQGLASLRGAAQPPRVFRLAPSRRLAHSLLSFSDLGAVTEGLELGRRDARALLCDAAVCEAAA